MIYSQRTLSLLAVLAALVAPGAAASAATYYVSPTGSDAAAGSSAAPWRTLQKAAATMVAGDTVLAADGDYPGGITQTRDGTAGAPITFRAVNPGKAVVRGDQTSNRDAIYLNESHYVVLDGLFVRNAIRAGLRISLTNGVVVRRCTFANNGTWGIFTDYDNDSLLEYNECYGSGREHGIYVSNGGDRPIVRFNKIHDNYASGIQINADPDFVDPSLGARADGITVNAVVEGNVVYNNGTAGGAAINLASVRNSRIVNNLLYNNKAGGISGWDNGAGVEWGSKNNLILHNTIYFQPGVGRWCISIKNGSTGNVVQNNVLSGGARGALEYDNDSSYVSDYNVLERAGSTGVVTNEDLGPWWTLAQWQSNSGNDLHSVDADPRFVNPTAATPDFQLQSSSPAIDSGVNRPDVTADLAGVTRPQNARWDMGCYERAGGAATPPAPTGVTALGGPNRVNLSWTAVGGATGYRLYRRVGSGAFGTPVVVTTTSYLDPGLVNGTTYRYVVRAYNAVGEGPASAEVAATPLAPPAAPTNLVATAGVRQVTLTWTQSTSPSLVQNSIYRSTTPGGPWQRIATISAGTTYVATGLASNVTYYFTVNAINANGTSGFRSGEASATPP